MCFYIYKHPVNFILRYTLNKEYVFYLLLRNKIKIIFISDPLKVDASAYKMTNISASVIRFYFL